MENPTPKRGRKRKYHVNSVTGLPVVGLTRRPDGRWRIIGTHRTFREPNEQKAIQKFNELTTDSDQLKQPPSHLRDGAFTAAVAANVTEKLVNIFVGHSSGMSDKYVLASPQIVKPATDAVWDKYLKPKPKKQPNSEKPS